MARYPIYNKYGTRLCYAKSVSFVGKWMEDANLTVDVESPVPVEFEIGSYIDYRGERYIMYEKPSVEKVARRSSYGGAFVYKSIRFDNCSCLLKGIRFQDQVTDENNVAYNVNPKFSFFCATIDNFVDKLIANISRRYAIYDKTKSDAEQQGSWNIVVVKDSSQTDARIEYATNVMVEIDNINVLDAMKIVVDKFLSSYVIRCVNGINTITIGSVVKGQYVKMLQYGKDKGLVSIEKRLGNSDDIVTRVWAYGSTANVPVDFYKNSYEPNYRIEPFKGQQNTLSQRFECYQIPNSNTVKMYLPVNSDPQQSNVFEFYFEAEPGKKYTGYIANNEEDVEFGYFNQAGVWQWNSGWFPATSWDVTGSVQNLRTKDIWTAVIQIPNIDNVSHFKELCSNSAIIVTKGIQKKYTGSHSQWWTAKYPIVPEALAIQNLMLPGYLWYYAWDGANKVLLNPALVEIVYQTDNVYPDHFVANGRNYNPVWKAYDGDARVVNITGSALKRFYTSPDYTFDICKDAYVDDEDAMEEYGIREGCVFFDGSSTELGEIKPTIQGMTVEQIRAAGYDIDIPSNDNMLLDEVLLVTYAKDVNEEVIDDIDDGFPAKNGVSDAELKRLDFYIYIKDIGFDIKNYLSSQNAQIQMMSGFCGSRMFELVNTTANPTAVKVYVKNVKTNNYSGKTIVCERDVLTEKMYNALTSGKSDYFAVKAWRVRCKRTYDEGLMRYFPNSDYPMQWRLRYEPRAMDVSQGIAHSDAFSLLNIEMPRVYVDAAAQWMKEETLRYIKNHNHAQEAYNLKMDNIFLERYPQWMTMGLLREGNMIMVKDDDLGIDVSPFRDSFEKRWYIETLSIREAENSLPDVSVTLRRDKEMSTFERISNQVVVLAERTSSGSTGASRIVSDRYYGGGGTTGGGTLNVDFSKYARLDGENVFTGENTFDNDIYANGFGTTASKEGIEDFGAVLYEMESEGYVYTDYLDVRKSASFKALMLEIGGKNVNVSTKIADVEQRVKTIEDAGYATTGYVDERIGHSGFSSFFKLVGRLTSEPSRIITSIPSGSVSGGVYICTANNKLYVEVYHTTGGAWGSRVVDGYMESWTSTADALNAMSSADYNKEGVCVAYGDEMWKYKGGAFDKILSSSGGGETIDAYTKSESDGKYQPKGDYPTTDEMNAAVNGAKSFGAATMVTSGDEYDVTVNDTLILIASGDTAEFQVNLPSNAPHGYRVTVMSSMNTLYICTTNGEYIYKNDKTASGGVVGNVLTLTHIASGGVYLWIAQ